MAKARLRNASAVVASVVALSLGVGLGAAVVMLRQLPKAPAQLASPTSDPSEVPVVTAEFDDARQVTLRVATRDGVAAVGNRSGIVTSSHCTPGVSATSGESLIEVDGLPLVSLATAKPPWRDLALGDKGADAAAVNAELARLGLGAPTSDVVTRETVRAFNGLLKTLGASVASFDTDLIERSLIVWLPSPEVQVGECKVATGANVEAGDELWVSPLEVVSAKIANAPTNLLEGDRVADIEGVVLSLDQDGSVTDLAALTELSGSGLLDAAEARADGLYEIGVTISLSQPINVAVVPPSAIHGLDGAKGCVDSGSRQIAVEVVGSQLGQTFVVVGGGESLTWVHPSVDAAEPCGAK
ncbi:MAG: hypothetical protein LBE08_04670 [Bifidobacteriaceae bacterium]|nr:hypothetical protein [Bifidobacteriaceae bacterium]